MSYILMFLINLIPGCKFRTDEEGEIVGVDEVELGEYAYDFVSLRREVDSSHGLPRIATTHIKPASVRSYPLAQVGDGGVPSEGATNTREAANGAGASHEDIGDVTHQYVKGTEGEYNEKAVKGQ